MMTHLRVCKLLGYRVLCRPYVEYKGAVPQNELQSKQNELQAEASNLITKGGKVCIVINFCSNLSLFLVELHHHILTLIVRASSRCRSPFYPTTKLLNSAVDPSQITYPRSDYIPR